MSATISQVRPEAPPPPTSGGARSERAPDHVTAIENLGQTLTNDVKNKLLAAVDTMQSDGVSHEDIKTFVGSELTSNGVDIESPAQRTGNFIDIMS